MPLFEMFQQHPTAYRLLLGRIVEQAAVQEVFVDGSENESAASEQFAQILIAGVGKFRHVVVAVNDEREWEGTWSIGIPNARVQRELVHAEAPISFAKVRFPAREIFEERRRVHRAGFDRDRFRVLGTANVGAASVGQELNRIGAGIRGIRRRELSGNGRSFCLITQDVGHGAIAREKNIQVDVSAYGNGQQDDGDDFLFESGLAKVSEEQRCDGGAENDFQQADERAHYRSNGPEYQCDQHATAGQKTREESWKLAKDGEEQSHDEGDEWDSESGDGEREREIDPAAESRPEVESADDGCPRGCREDGPARAHLGFRSRADINPGAAGPITKSIPALTDARTKGRPRRGQSRLVDGRH